MAELELCFYCGINPGVGIDHIVPRSKGGTRRPSNTVWACQACNSSKGTRSLDEWIASLERRMAVCNHGCPHCCPNNMRQPLPENLVAVLERASDFMVDHG